MTRETKRQREGEEVGDGWGQLIGWRSVTCTTCNRRFLAPSAGAGAVAGAVAGGSAGASAGQCRTVGRHLAADLP